MKIKNFRRKNKTGVSFWRETNEWHKEKKVETDVMDVELKKKVEKVVKVAGKVGKAQIGETKHNAKQKMKLQCVA